ncbi:MAG TPA: ATP-grasp domain-containing protein, partial [Sphingomicrobium sp.]|nr:ATP-grasp domain-containing protein [Sphingomicrobium sp.]
ATRDGVMFCPPVGHRQEAGDYRESWQPAAVAPAVLRSAEEQAEKLVTALGGYGLFGVEFFIAGAGDQQRAIFSELSPRPHDTGMVTLIGQSPNQFELHLRALLGLTIGQIALAGPSASAAILSGLAIEDYAYDGVTEALGLGTSATPVDLRLFAKPVAHRGRRMGVALARAASVAEAVELAVKAAATVQIVPR